MNIVHNRLRLTRHWQTSNREEYIQIITRQNNNREIAMALVFIQEVVDRSE